jgi:hypothetical protein
MRPGHLHDSEDAEKLSESACRQKARECIDNANRTRAEHNVSARWSQLAEHWIRKINDLIQHRA